MGARPPRVWPGRPYPLGATRDGAGVNFAPFSERATGLELCLIDGGDAGRQVARMARAAGPAGPAILDAGAAFEAVDRSLAVFRAVGQGPAPHRQHQG